MTTPKNVLIFICGLLLTTGIACTQGDNKTTDTFKELPDPTVDTLSDWSGIPEGLQVSFVSIDQRYPKSVVPEVTPSETVRLTGWKGEKLSAQLLLWTGEEIENVEVKFTGFRTDDGTVLSDDIAQARFVRYVM